MGVFHTLVLFSTERRGTFTVLTYVDLAVNRWHKAYESLDFLAFKVRMNFILLSSDRTEILFKIILIFSVYSPLNIARIPKIVAQWQFMSLFFFYYWLQEKDLSTIVAKCAVRQSWSPNNKGNILLYKRKKFNCMYFNCLYIFI